MLVTCDQCGQSYQVNEDRLPAQGARVKCPTCAHLILVRPNVAAAPSEAPAEPVSEAKPSDDVTWKIRDSVLTYTFHDLASLQDWLKGRTTLENVKVAKGEDDWKELGDYSEVLTTELITKFFPLGDVPKTSTKGNAVPATASMINMMPVASTPSPNMNFGVASASKNTMRSIAKTRKEEKKRRQNDSKLLKTVAAAIFMIACVMFALYFMGVIDKDTFVKKEIPAGYHIEMVNGVEKLVANDEQPIVKTAPPKPVEEEPVAMIGDEAVAVPEADVNVPVDPNANLISDEEAEKIMAEEAEKLLSQARDNIKKRNWPVAQTILISFLKEHPDHKEAKQLLVKVYRGLGQNEKAEELEAEIKALR